MKTFGYSLDITGEFFVLDEDGRKIASQPIQGQMPIIPEALINWINQMLAAKEQFRVSNGFPPSIAAPEPQPTSTMPEPAEGQEPNPIPETQ